MLLTMKEGWQRYIAPDGEFELWLPPGAPLQEDATTPPGESYLTWSPRPDLGAFSLLREPAPGRTPGDVLALEKRLGVRVAVEVDESVNREGHRARRLRYRAVERRPRETVEDPATGMRSHLPERQVIEIADYTFWQGEKEAIRVGYRVNADAPADLIATFVQMAERFRLLKALR
jgi:hypothetical protein